MMGIFEMFAPIMGPVLRWIYMLVPTFLLAMLIFTVVMRLILFPLSIKTQKAQADRARLAPRLERIQKKYAADRNKVMQKQQELYEKEGVKMTPGCLPMLLQMLVLFSIIAVIYKPLTYVHQVSAEDITICKTAVAATLDEKITQQKNDKTELQRPNGYYGELYLMRYVDSHAEVMEKALTEKGRTPAQITDVMTKMQETKDQFVLFGNENLSLLYVPKDSSITPHWTWIIVLLSGGSALLSGLLSMKYSKAAMSQEQQQMNGCTNGMMYVMPIMSLIFSFQVPAGVAVYWTFSNLLAMVQTFVLNKMYNPAKIRAQAEAEYAERRRRKAEDKARLKAARIEEQRAWQMEENEKKAAAQGKGKKKPADTPATPAEMPEDKPAEAVAEAEKEEEQTNE